MLITKLEHISVFVHDTATNKGVQVSLQDPDFLSFGNTHRNGMTGSNRNSDFLVFGGNFKLH